MKVAAQASMRRMPTPQDELEQAIEREPSNEELKSATLLLVDDNLQNVELMQAWLESMECKLVTAHDGVEAIEAVARSKPDLILLDVMMPRMSGFEVCRKIKQDSALRDTVIIMVTALNEVGDFERAVECGCDDFLTKPVNKLELITRVRSLLRVRLLKRRVEALLKNPRLSIARVTWPWNISCCVRSCALTPSQKIEQGWWDGGRRGSSRRPPPHNCWGVAKPRPVAIHSARLKRHA